MPSLRPFDFLRVAGVTLGLLAGAGVAQAAPACPVPAGDLDPKTVVGQVSGKAITLAEVDAKVPEGLCQARIEARQKLDELRQGGLTRLIDERLLEAEAKKQGLADLEALLKKVMGTLTAPDDKAVAEFYAQYKDRMQGASLEEVSPKIREVLVQKAEQEAFQKLVGDLRAAAKVVEDLPPLRMPVEAKGYARGPANAPITIVMFSDYECPYCSRGVASVDAVRAKYGDKVRVVYRDYPLAFHQQAVPAAVSARCAGEQGKFWEMHDLLYANQQNLDPQTIEGHATKLSLDKAKYTACLQNPKQREAIQADFAAGGRLGVDGTPAFFINGIKIGGAQPIEAFSVIIDRELARPAKK
jgi:protein-disulfide isomerase